MNILEVKESAKDIFLAKPNVVGVGIGYKVTGGKQTKTLGLIVLVEKKLPPSALKTVDRLPAFLVTYNDQGVSGGVVPVDVIEAEEIKALSYTSRLRPAPGGVSIGHYKITAGTLGTLVYDVFDEQPLILSNNHVLANSNDANLGESILQPGPYDGGRVDKDVIAELERFIPIDFGEDSGDCTLAETFARATNYITGVIGSQHRVRIVKENAQAVNYVDAAVARPVVNSDVTKEILDIGEVVASEKAVLGMEVHKTGRTTEHTEGVITLINATVKVNYGGDKLATFEDQIISSYMSQGGDSGSLLVSKEDNKAVGLLYAGSNQLTIYNPIQRVLDQLTIKL